MFCLMPAAVIRTSPLCISLKSLGQTAFPVSIYEAFFCQLDSSMSAQARVLVPYFLDPWANLQLFHKPSVPCPSQQGRDAQSRNNIKSSASP
jgi:hypothetical protein